MTEEELQDERPPPFPRAFENFYATPIGRPWRWKHWS